MTVICHIGEWALKGKNRGNFEKVLLFNMKKRLETCHSRVTGEKDFSGKKISIRSDWGRIIVELPDSLKQKDVQTAVSQIFGLSNFSFAQKTENNIKKIAEKSLLMLEKAEFETFRVSTRRAIKHFPMNSEEINRKIGAQIGEKFGKKVSLKNADLELFIEITAKGTFIYSKKIKGAGGMPVGTAGTALILLSGGLDSPISAYYALKRGLKTKFIHFHSAPYTSKQSIEKVKRLAKELQKFGASGEIFLVPFADAQKEIMMNIPDKYRIIFYRRIMLQIAESVAKRNKCKALVTGDSLAQVASQTLENLHVVGSASDMLLLRPLIGFDKEEIMDLAKKIGTYEISIEPHDDCCSRLMPKKPETRANLKDILEAEKNLDVQKIISETLARIEKVVL